MNAKVYELTKDMPSVEEVRRQQEEATLAAGQQLSHEKRCSMAKLCQYALVMFNAYLLADLFTGIVGSAVVAIVAYFAGGTPHAVCALGGVFLGLCVAVVMLAYRHSKVYSALEQMQKRRQA